VSVQPHSENEIGAARLRVVTALPEALGRQKLAKHLASKTVLSIQQIRDALSLAGRDVAEIAAGNVVLFREGRGF
jgi:hypothetical protein